MNRSVVPSIELPKVHHKKVVILTQYFPPEMGAPQARLYETALGLKTLGWEVQIISALPNYPTGRIFVTYKYSIYWKEEIGGLQVRRFWIFASNSRQTLPRIVNMASFALSSFFSVFFLWRFKPTYLIVESPPLLTGLSGLILSRLSGAKLVLNISDIWPLSAAELGAIHKGSKFYRGLEGLERFLYRQAYGCLGQSEEIVRHVSRNGARQAKLFRNGVDANRFVVEDKRCYEKPLKMVYAGLLGVAQGIFELCRELDLESGNIEFHIYGSGAERKLIEEYLKNSEKAGIFLHESIDREEVPAVLSKHHLTLIPLKKPIYGAVPSKIYEAMAAGLPILFAGGGEGASIVSEYKVGWTCEPSDYHAMNILLKQLENLAEDEWELYRQNCLLAAKNSFDRGAQIEGLHKWLV